MSVTLRTRAIEFALQAEGILRHNREPHMSTVIERAREYYKFLKGEGNVENLHSASAPVRKPRAVRAGKNLKRRGKGGRRRAL